MVRIAGNCCQRTRPARSAGGCTVAGVALDSGAEDELIDVARCMPSRGELARLL